MSLIGSFFDKWKELMYDDADPRTRDKFLMGSPLLVIAICCLYAFLIKRIMPKVMDQRKAFNTRWVSLSLNFYLFLTASYFFYKSVKIGWFTKYSWRCEPIDRSNSEEAIEVNNWKKENKKVLVLLQCRRN